MDYSKVDAALATALREVTQPDAHVFPVFVSISDPPATLEPRWRRILGVDEAGPGPGIVTTTVSATQIAELSEQPWVSAITLAQWRRTVSVTTS